jgi:hypothetical protein
MAPTNPKTALLSFNRLYFSNGDTKNIGGIIKEVLDRDVFVFVA